jgi:hypothetical protein
MRGAEFIGISQGWTPAQLSSGTPWWPYWEKGWGSQQKDTYNPAHYLTPQSVAQLRNPRNYVIPRSTYVPPPNPYTDRAWLAMWGGMGRHTPEEIYRNGQDFPMVRGW